MVDSVKRNGPYAPLSANYADDDAIAQLDVEENDVAELLYLRSLAFSARDLSTEGRVSMVALKSGRLLRRKRMDKVLKAAETLVSVGLWTREDGGYRVTAWLKWNKSWAELTHKRAVDAQRKRGDRPPESTPDDGGVHDDSARIPDGVQSDSARVATPEALHFTTHHDTTQQEDLSAAPSHQIRSASEFDQWWSVYPHKVAKEAGRKAFAKARRGASLADLISGAERYRDDPTRKPDFTQHPATWLNAGRWQDEAPASPRGSRPSIQTFTDQEYASGW